MSEPMAAQLDLEDLRRLIAETIDVDISEVTDDASFVDDLEVDSLLALEIAVRLEKSYGITVDDGELADVTTLRATFALLEKKAGARA